MKLNIKAFSISALIIGAIPGLILFTWCSANGFGAELVKLFESIHPSGGLSILENMRPEMTFVSRVPGILINTIYAGVDSFIAGFAFASLYNFLTGRFTAKMEGK
ncbi:MAG: hypothetical protein GY754_43475 [bacterium]|nr:hypothetical protein [bacterium]